MGLTRSEQMSRIRGRNTSPELVVRRGLWAKGYRYRLQQKTPGGRADLVIRSRKLALFVDGCFWHGCPEHYVRPRSSNSFWDKKLNENVTRDRRQTLKLENEGWRVVRVWEHEIAEDPEAALSKIVEALEGVPPKRRRAWRVMRVEWVDQEAGRERRFLEDLLDPAFRRVEERIRSTKKVGRVRSRVVKS